jgi:hypothetical protein
VDGAAPAAPETAEVPVVSEPTDAPEVAAEADSGDEPAK